MCIAVMKPEGKIIPKDTLQECWDSNPDGAGFMYTSDGHLRIEKGFMEFEDFWSAWKDKQDEKAVLHFRIRTHGATDPENTHPFQVGKTLGFVHNGIISTTIHDKQFSDTYHFNRNILQKIYKGDTKFIFKDHYQELIGNYIGYSKLVFLTAKGEHTIINEDKGVWDEGVWYSNRSYLPRPVPKPQQIKPALPVAAGSRGLIVGERVEVKGHPSIEGNGFIAYFGQGAIIGVQLDDRNYTVGVHSGFVYPQQNVIEVLGVPESNGIAVGDYVYRVGYENIIGEVMKIKGDRAKVEFFNHGVNTTYTIWTKTENLDHWENMSCGV